jgi:hypothetical protein
VVSGTSGRTKKVGIERKVKKLQVQFAPQQFNGSNLLFVWPIAPRWNQPTTSSNNPASR